MKIREFAMNRSRTKRAGGLSLLFFFYSLFCVCWWLHLFYSKNYTLQENIRPHPSHFGASIKTHRFSLNKQNSLKDHGVGYTKNTTYVAHGLVGGVLGLAAMSYQAAFKGGDEVAAAYASVAAFAWWNITAARRVFIEKAKVIGPKINFCISGAMLGLFTYALAN